MQEEQAKPAAAAACVRGERQSLAPGLSSSDTPQLKTRKSSGAGCTSVTAVVRGSGRRGAEALCRAARSMGLPLAAAGPTPSPFAAAPAGAV